MCPVVITYSACFPLMIYSTIVSLWFVYGMLSTVEIKYLYESKKQQIKDKLCRMSNASWPVYGLWETVFGFPFSSWLNGLCDWGRIWQISSLACRCERLNKINTDSSLYSSLPIAHVPMITPTCAPWCKSLLSFALFTITLLFLVRFLFLGWTFEFVS